MVVIMIIGIISGVVLTAMGSGDQSRKVDAGVTRMDSVFSLARSAAITRQQTTRVLIHFNPADQDKFLRYATIVYDNNSDPDAADWKLYSEGIFLPGGVYFSPALSTISTATDSASPPLQTWTGFVINPTSLSIETPTYTAPLQPVTNYGLASGNSDPLTHGPAANKWYVYEFNPNGTFSNPLARVVLVGGLPIFSPPSILIPLENDVEPYELAKGFVLFKSGKLLHMQNSDQIRGN
jgi:hypothetical protein